MPDRARALTGLGQIERDLGNTAHARELYSQAVALYRNTADIQKLAHTIRHVADMDREAGDLDAAEPAYREALALYREQKSTTALDLANTVNGLANLLTMRGARNEARQLTEEARDLYSSQAKTPGVDAGVQECSRRLAKLNAAL